MRMLIAAAMFTTLGGLVFLALLPGRPPATIEILPGEDWKPLPEVPPDRPDPEPVYPARGVESPSRDESEIPAEEPPIEHAVAQPIGPASLEVLSKRLDGLRNEKGTYLARFSRPWRKEAVDLVVEILTEMFGENWTSLLSGYCTSHPPGDDTLYVLYLFAMLERADLREHALGLLERAEKPGLFPCFYLATVRAGEEGAARVCRLLEGKWADRQGRRSISWWERRWLQTILCRSSSRVAGLHFLQRYLGTGDVEQRRGLATILGSVAHPDVIRDLIPLAMNEPDAKARVSLLRAVGAMAGAGGLPALRAHLLADPSPQVRIEAARILGEKFPGSNLRFGGRRSIIAPKSTRNRYLGASAYTGMRERLTTLYSSLLDGSKFPPKVRPGDPWENHILDPLTFALESDVDPAVRLAAAKKLAEIADSNGTYIEWRGNGSFGLPQSAILTLRGAAKRALADPDPRVRAAADEMLANTILLEVPDDPEGESAREEDGPDRGK